MPLTDSLAEVTQAIVDRLQANKVGLGLQDVWYGDEELIPRTPAVSVAADSKRRQIQETGGMVRNDFTVLITTFHSKLQVPTRTRKESDELAEAIESVLHQDRTFGGLLVHSYVIEIASGFIRRNNVVMKSSRLTWTGFNKTRMI